MRELLRAESTQTKELRPATTAVCPMPFDFSLIGRPTDPFLFRYDWTNAVLYALSVGATPSELDYLFEGRGPKVYPSFVVVAKYAPMFDLLARCGGDLAMMVHGSERIVLERPLPASAEVLTRSTIRAIYDLRRFAQVIIDTESVDASGTPLARTASSILFRNAGGFGGDAPARETRETQIPKDQQPDFTIEETTLPTQALTYRLNGDFNPLHADPAFAAAVGFERGPILHGLGTYGYMARHVALGACQGDADQIDLLEGSFRKPVWPGETLVTSGWKVDARRIALQMKVRERDEVVIGGASARLRA